VGGYEGVTRGAQDSELLERLEASEAAVDVTGVLVFDWSSNLMPELHNSLYSDELTESAQNKVLQQLGRIAQPLHQAAAMVYRVRKAKEKYQETGDQTFADEASLDHARVRNILGRAHQETTKLPQTDQVKKLSRRILEAVYLNHDASEMLVGNAYNPDQERDNHGRWAKGQVSHEEPGHHGAAWRGNVSGHVRARANAQPTRGLGEDSQWRTADEEYEASQGARHVSEDAAEAVHQFLEGGWPKGRREEERNTVYRLALAATNYANKAALYVRQGHNEYVEPGGWQQDYKDGGAYHQLAAQTHIRLANELRRTFISRHVPGVNRSDVQRIINRNLLAGNMHRDAGLMLTGNSSTAYLGQQQLARNAGQYDEAKHKRDNAGKFSSTGGGGGGAAPQGTTATTQPAEEPYRPRQRLQDAQGGEAYTDIREALQADVLTRPIAGVLAMTSSKFQTGVDKQYGEEVQEVFKGIFSRLTLGTGPLAVKAVAAGVRQSPRLFRLLVQGVQEVKGGGATRNSFNPDQARDANGRWSRQERSMGQRAYGALEKLGVVAGLGLTTYAGAHSLVAGGVNAGLAGVSAAAGSGAVASPVAMGASLYLPAAGTVGLSSAAAATVAGATGVGLLAMPLIIGLATKGKAGGLLTEEAYNEMTDVFQGIFSRMTLGTGPLAVRATAAGIRHSPKLFRLLMRGLNEAASGATAVGRGLGHAAVGAGQGLAAGYRAATHNSEGDNCGTGAGGFKRGNTCGRSGRFGDSRDTSDHWQEDHQGVQLAEQEVHKEIGPILQRLELDLYHNQDYLGMGSYYSAARILNWFRESYYEAKGHVNSARHRANTYHKTGLSSDRAMVRTWYRKASDEYKRAANELSLLTFKDKSKVASLLKEMQNLTHDAAETLTGNSFDPNQPRDDLGRWSLAPYQHSGHTQRQHEVNRPHSTLRPTQTMLEEEQEAANEAWKVDDLATAATARVINPIWDSRGIRFIRGLTDEALNMITHDNERASNHSWMAKDMALKENLDSVPAGRDDNFTYRASVVAYLDAASTRRERIAEALERFFIDLPVAQEAVRLNREAAALLRDAAEMTQR
jgi:hypothetical protein